MKATNLVLAVAMAFSGAVSAKVTLDDDRGDTTFRVGDVEVTAIAALSAAQAGQQVYKCRPKGASGKKKFFGKSGGLEQVVECTPVELKVSAKTGSPKWKTIK